MLAQSNVIVGAGLKSILTDDSDKSLKPTSKIHGLTEIIRALKTFSSRRINEKRQKPGVPVWQRNYFEHVIRNDESLSRLREYIVNNPLQWEIDNENPSRKQSTESINPPF
jgi:hypothetical protein